MWPTLHNKTGKHGGENIMVWGNFSWNVFPKQWSQKFTKVYLGSHADICYRRVALRWVFQQYNYPRGSSKLVSFWFRENNIRFLEWSSQSPDLNPIENLWGDLNNRFRKDDIENKTELWQKVQEICPSESIIYSQKIMVDIVDINLILLVFSFFLYEFYFVCCFLLYFFNRTYLYD